MVGAFVLGAMFLALALVFATARAQRWFERVVPIQLVLPEDGSFGLRRGSSVELLGSTVGSVDEISIDDQTDRMQARLLIQSAFIRFVRVDSRFMIKRKTLGLTGDAFVEITRGTKAAAPPGEPFFATSDREPAQLMQDISAELLPTIRAARDVIQNHGTLAQSLADPQGSLLQSLQRVDRLLQALERGDGVVGRLLQDAQWATKVDGLLQSAQLVVDQLRTSVDDVVTVTKTLAKDASGLTTRATALLDSAQTSVDRLPAVVDDTRRALATVQELLQRLLRASAVLPEVAEVVRTEARGLDGVVAQSRHTLAEVEKLVLALQDHWLIRSYVPPAPENPRMSPSELSGAGGRR